MNIEHPTVEIFFVFAFTRCKLRVYAPDESFSRRLLETAGVEFFEPADEGGLEVDTRLMMDIVRCSLPKLLADALKEHF